jgi:thioredoxin reductase
MAVDTPAKIAIIGAGPIGLEAALYARYLGYDVALFERHAEPAGEVAQWNHLPLFTPWQNLHSSLGMAALRAQDEQRTFPSNEALITAEQWRTDYLLPLAESDLLCDHLCLQTKVLQVGKVQLLKQDQPTGEYNRGAWDFRLLVETAGGEQRIEAADVLFDCAGITSHSLPMGHGGIPAAGEFTSAAVRDRIAYGFPDILGCARARYANQRVLVVGDDPYVVYTIQALLQLQKTAPQTEIVWCTRRARDEQPSGPVQCAEMEAWPAGQQLFAMVNAAALQGQVEWRPETWIETIRLNEQQQLELLTSGAVDETLLCDQVIVHTGYRDIVAWTSELSLSPADARSIITSEPNYYQLGARRWGRKPGFIFSAGLRDICETFKIIGDRPTLDLYAKYDE